MVLRASRGLQPRRTRACSPAPSRTWQKGYAPNTPYPQHTSLRHDGMGRDNEREAMSEIEDDPTNVRPPEEEAESDEKAENVRPPEETAENVRPPE